MGNVDSTARISDATSKRIPGRMSLTIAANGYPRDRWGMPPKKPPAEKLAAQGARIREAIARAGKSQADVCREIGVNGNTMNRWLNGKNSAKDHFDALELALGVPAKWIEHGEGVDVTDRMSVIEQFILQQGPTLRPPLTRAEATTLRAWPYHRVRVGDLLNAVTELRRGLSAEEIEGARAFTEAVRARGEALGVPKRKP